jgi:hypothetical protein
LLVVTYQENRITVEISLQRVTSSIKLAIISRNAIMYQEITGLQLKAVCSSSHLQLEKGWGWVAMAWRSTDVNWLGKGYGGWTFYSFTKNVTI